MDNLTDDENPNDTWVSLGDILNQSRHGDKPKVTVALLKEVIEAKGVRTHDQWGKLISATDGDTNEITSEKYVYALLALYYAELTSDDRDTNPDRWFEYCSPLHEYGWLKDETPDFAEWIAKSNQMCKKKTSTLTSYKNVADWKIQAVRIADEFFDRDTKLGTRDSLAGYSKRVMEELQKREIHGPRGRITNKSTIMREALQSEKWWKGKKP